MYAVGYFQSHNVLKGYEVSDSHLKRVDEIVRTDKLQRDNYDQVANLLAKTIQENPQYAGVAQKTLEKLLDKDLPPKVRYQVRKLVSRN